MKKLHSLREHLLQQVPSLDPENLLTFVREGKVHSSRGTANQNYQLRYPITLILTNYAGTTANVLIPMLMWLDEHQPDHAEDPITFGLDILNHESVDLTLTIEVTEITQVQPDPAHPGCYLTHVCPEPKLDEL